MERNNYHHDNLQKELLEEGVRFIAMEGRNNFSLRGLAKRVGVTPTACYNHYKNAASIINAMKCYVDTSLCDALQSGITQAEETGMPKLFGLAVAYVSFFYDNPNYFGFLFENSELNINVTQDGIFSDYPPFTLFLETAYKEMTLYGVEEKDYRDFVLNKWSVVHGLAAMVNMKGMKYSGNIQELVKRVLLGGEKSKCKLLKDEESL